ncbi:MAG: NAD-dependent epimerase/dehydratase family protein [Candidatus Methylomirabilis sp.]|nr:NAD-dependent epimerase/dehydratase family protein [Deltaproteobacteria bacterium]
MKTLITGATGFLGGHIAEKLVARGREEVRALARPTSDTRRLRKLGVEVVEGDVADPASLERAMRGVERVHHAAAKVGDWGPREDFERMTVEGTRNVLEAAHRAGASNFLHVSSVSVYGLHCHRDKTPKHGPVRETDPLGQHLWRDDWYSMTKIEAEREALAYHEAGKLSVRVIRPAWIYGPGDRTSLPRLVKFLRKNGGLLIGKGDNRLSLTYGPNVADAALLAMEAEAAAGECFNVSNDGEITQAEYMTKVCAILGLAAPCKMAPYGVAYFAGAALERGAKLLRAKEPPALTRFGVTLIGNDNLYSHEKAKKVLGWSPKVLYDEGITAALDWYFCKESGACA